MSDLALGDINGDGFLDIVTLFSETSRVPNPIYLNDGSGAYASSQSSTINCSFATIRCFGQNGDLALALADFDSNQALDIITYGNSREVNLYLNDGNGNFDWPGATRSFISEPDGDTTRQIAVGDLNEDGHIDLVLGRRAYLNDGLGNLNAAGAERVFADQSALAVAVGDLNNDGHLDIVTGYEVDPGRIYFNDGSGNFDWPGAEHTFDESMAFIYSLDLADVNNDGALDIVSGVFQGRNQVYLNDGRGNFNWQGSRRLFGSPDDRARRIRAADLNGDNYLDIVVANQESADTIYLNDGQGNFNWPGAERSLGPDITDSEVLAIGDVNGDGAQDVIVGKRSDETGHTVHINSQMAIPRQPNRLPTVIVPRPVQTQEAAFFSTPEILTDDRIDVSFKLADPDGDPVHFVRAYYSPNGGGQWFPALQPNGSNRMGELAANCLGGCEHTFTWDVYKSGFFGKSDNMVFRIEAYPGHTSAAKAVPGLGQRPYTTATSFPFRVRGTQVRVLDQAGQPYPNAIVYRLPSDETRGATIFPPRPDGLKPLTTDSQGYLEGRGELSVATDDRVGDRLLAMAVISSTTTYTIYHTSAAPIASGLDMAEVRAPGVQTLRINPDRPLILFNLNVSLEWDARSDPDYLARLRNNLVRTSEFLFDWSDGQIALGDIYVYQDRERWDTAHVRIYATNALRPNAVKGGIVGPGTERPDPERSDISYTAGQVRMGATWNRYGEVGNNLGEDWPRTLAHEIGHFALFLDDNYIGLDNNESLITIDGCRGAMADPYRSDFSEFHPSGSDWDVQCNQTLSAWTTRLPDRTAGRADWQTIRLFYEDPQAQIRLNEPATYNAQPGPSLLPLAVTSVNFVEPSQPDQTLAAPIFLTVDENGARTTVGRSARAFLFQVDRLMDLGKPVSDQILARGAAPGDRLCIYDPDSQRAGCRTVSAIDQRITLEPTLDMRPDIRITPVTSTTLDLEIYGLPAGLEASAQLYPGNASAAPPVALDFDGASYNGQLRSSPDSPAFDGYIHLTIAETPGTDPGYETVVDFALGGNPGRKWASRAPRGNPGRKWASRAPVVSNDGEAILYEPGVTLAEGQFFALQATDILPPAPVYAKPLGRAYRLSATPGVAFEGTSLSIAYRGEDVPEILESGIELYYWDGVDWHRLTETRRDANRNEISAPISGPGLYALMTSVNLDLRGPDWNDIRFPGEGGPLPEILGSIDEVYTMVYQYVDTDHEDPWKLHAPEAPAWVNDLTDLTYNTSYWIYATQNTSLLARPPESLPGINALLGSPAATLSLPPATFYGFVESDAVFTAAAGQQVEAFVGTTLCGQGRTLQIDTKIVYSIAVESISPTLADCGAVGRTVTFQVAGEQMNARVAWDNTRLTSTHLVRGRPASETWLLHLPLLSSDSE
jgi:hypothetical protein